MKDRKTLPVSMIFRFLAGALIFAVLFVQLSYLHRGYERMMRFYGLPEQSLDVAVVGTSSTFTAYMPMEVWNEKGIASAVIATNMQFEGTLSYTLKEIEKYQTPKVWLIDVMPFIRAHYAGQSDWEPGDRNLNIRYNVDSLRYSPERVSLIREICQDSGLGLREEIYYNFDMVRYHMTRLEFAHFNNSLHDINYGFQHLQKEGGDPFDPAEMIEGTEKETVLTGTELKNLEELLLEAQHLKEKGAQVFFYCPPVWFFSEEDGGRKTFLKRVITERGFGFWDLTKEKAAAGLDPDEDYRDFMHFDSLGAGKVTGLLEEHLCAECALPDRRQDPAYASWNADYLRWKELLGGYLDVDKRAVQAMREQG